MTNYLIKTCYWADEADFPSFCLMSEKELDRAKALVKEFFTAGRHMTISVGTNEEIDFDRCNDVFNMYYREINLSETEYEVIYQLFGEVYGQCSFARIVENIEWRLEDEQDEQDVEE